MVSILLLTNGSTCTSVDSLLHFNPGWEICARVTDSKEAIEKVIKLKPDAVVIGSSVPFMDRQNCVCEIRRVAPNTKLVLTNFV
jgi:DNA-binding NarL/FixJ family response regulator